MLCSNLTSRLFGLETTELKEEGRSRHRRRTDSVVSVRYVSIGSWSVGVIAQSGDASQESVERVECLKTAMQMDLKALKDVRTILDKPK